MQYLFFLIFSVLSLFAFPVKAAPNGHSDATVRYQQLKHIYTGKETTLFEREQQRLYQSFQQGELSLAMFKGKSSAVREAIAWGDAYSPVVVSHLAAVDPSRLTGDEATAFALLYEGRLDEAVQAYQPLQSLEKVKAESALLDSPRVRATLQHEAYLLDLAGVNPDRCAQLYECLVTRDDCPCQLRFQYADFLYRHQRYADADRWGRAALNGAIEPDVQMPIRFLLGQCYAEQNQPEVAQGYLLNALGDYNRLSKTQQPLAIRTYASTLQSLASVYLKLGDRDNSMLYYDRTVALLDSLLSAPTAPAQSSAELVWPLTLLHAAGTEYLEYGVAEDAYHVYERSLEVLQSTPESDASPALLSHTYRMLSHTLWDEVDSLEEAENYLLMAEEKIKEVLPTAPSLYQYTLYQVKADQSIFQLFCLGDTVSSLALSEEANDILLHLYNACPALYLDDYALGLSNLGYLYYQHHDYDKAMECYTAAETMVRPYYQQNPDDYRYCYNVVEINMSSLMLEMGRFAEGIRWAKQALPNIRKLYALSDNAINTGNLQLTLRNFALCLVRSGKNNEAQPYIKEALALDADDAELSALANN